MREGRSGPPQTQLLFSGARCCTLASMSTPVPEETRRSLAALEERTRAAIGALRGLEEMAQSNHPNNGGIPSCM